MLAAGGPKAITPLAILPIRTSKTSLFRFPGCSTGWAPLIRTFWAKLDKPTNRRLIDSILDTCNIWLSGLVGTDRLLEARAEMLEKENNLLDLMAGILYIHIYMTPPSPM